MIFLNESDLISGYVIEQIGRYLPTDKDVSSILHVIIPIMHLSCGYREARFHLDVEIHTFAKGNRMHYSIDFSHL